MNKSKKVWHIFAFIGVFAVAIAVVMLLWNALIPSIIGWSAINYWQSAGLIILSRLLFGGLGRHKHGPFLWKYDKEHMLLHEKLKGMSQDERRNFIRQRMSGEVKSDD